MGKSRRREVGDQEKLPQKWHVQARLKSGKIIHTGSASFGKNWVRVIALSSNATRIQNMRRSWRRTTSRRPKWTLIDWDVPALTWIPLKICGLNWRPRYMPQTIESGGARQIRQRKPGWDFSGDVCETYWKLQPPTPGCYPAMLWPWYFIFSEIIWFLSAK